MPGPCAQQVLPSMGLRLIPALGWQGAGGWRWGGREGGRRCRKGLVAKMHHRTAPEVLPCTAAPSHYGSTLWARAGVYTHALTRTCPLFFLGLSTVEQLKQMALQQVALQSAAFQ